MLRGFTRAIRRICGMASEFTRGMEDLASDNELGDIKSTMADVNLATLIALQTRLIPGWAERVCV